MDLQQHYAALYKQSIENYKNKSYQVDKLIDSTTDKRFGITLLIRPPQKIKSEIKKVLAKVKEVEPDQYFYPEPDMHITVMSIISCYEGFGLSQIDVGEYVNVIQKCLSGLPPFTIQFKGLTASPSCLMVQGFLSDGTLNQIRDNLRINFKSSDLQHSIDKRYAIRTAHSTIFRLKNKLSNKDKFLATVERYKNYEFGTFIVDTMDLVFNDWYQREKRVKKLHEFRLE